MPRSPPRVIILPYPLKLSKDKNDFPASNGLAYWADAEKSFEELVQVTNEKICLKKLDFTFQEKRRHVVRPNGFRRKDAEPKRYNLSTFCQLAVLPTSREI